MDQSSGSRSARAIRSVGIVHQDVIEEAVPDAVRKFLELRRSGSRIDDPGSWLAVVAKRNAISLVRKQSNRDRIDKKLARSARLTTGPSDLDVVARDIVESLSPKHREVVEKLLEGHSKPEIAEVLRISKSGVYRRVEEVKRILVSLMLGDD